jgi:hypothetical protein
MCATDFAEHAGRHECAHDDHIIKPAWRKHVAVIGPCTVPIEIVEPSNSIQRWRLPGKDKERACQSALEPFPAARALLARKRDHGRAEAPLGLYGIRNSRVVAAPPGAQPGLIKQGSI